MQAVQCRVDSGELKSIRSLEAHTQPAMQLLAMGVLEGEVNPHLIASGLGGLVLARDMSLQSGVVADLAAVVELSPAWLGGPVFAAAAFDGTLVVDDVMKEACSVSHGQFYRLVEEAYERLADMAEKYQRRASFPDLSRSTAIVIDDGFSGPLCVKAAMAAARNAGARRVVLVMPVAERRALYQCAQSADQTHCASTRRLSNWTIDRNRY